MVRIGLVGQCGNQIGGAFWPLALHEHGVLTPFAAINVLQMQRDRAKFTDDLSDALNSFFYIPENAGYLLPKKLADLDALKVRARAVLVDMEDSVVSRFQQGPLRHLFDQTCTIANYPGSGNNWAVGHYTHGQAYHDKIEEALRRTSERCDSLHGFLIIHSLGGGTGSGLGTSIIELLCENYLRIDRFVSCVHPASNQDVVTAPYNVLLATEKLMEHATCVLPADNSALIDICNLDTQKYNNQDQLKYNATCEPFQDMNSIIVNMLLHLTSGSRFPGNLNIDMNEIATNLVAYPKLHYLFSSKKTKFTTWSQEATKVGLCSVPPAGHGSSVLSLLNSTSMSLMLKDIVLGFDRLYQRKAHVHHYLEVGGCEEADFQDARSSVLSVCERYEELQSQQSTNVPRLQLI